MTLAVPCLIFTALMGAEIEPAALTALSLRWALVAYVAVIAASWALVALAGLERRAHVAPLAFGNTGNIGLPLALFAYGETGLSLAVVVFAVMALLTFTVGLWLVAGAAQPARVLREPMLWATLLGGLFLSMGWHTPEWLTRSLSLVGADGDPLMLITLGVAIARLTPGRLGRAAWLSASETGAGAGGGRGGRALVRAGAHGLRGAGPAMAMPVAVTSYLLAERYDADPDAVAGRSWSRPLMAVAALPVTLSFLL